MQIYKNPPKLLLSVYVEKSILLLEKFCWKILFDTLQWRKNLKRLILYIQKSGFEELG